MKKNSKVKMISATIAMLIGGVALTTNFAKAGALDSKNVKVVSMDKKKDITLERMKKLPVFAKAGLTPVKFIETNGIYYTTVRTIKGQQVGVFLTKNLNLLIHSGQAIMTETGAQFAPPINISELNGKESFNYGTGKEEIYVFTDPQCPYCQRFEKKWDGLKDKYTMHVYMMPLSFHQEAPEMTHWILSAKTDKEKEERLSKIANGSQEYKGFMKTETVDQYKKIEKEIKYIRDYAATNGVTGTPTVLGKDGKRKLWTQL